MSNTDASEENVESPSTYGNYGYREYRKTEKKKIKTKKDDPNLVTDYSKYSVGVEPEEVPASPESDENK